MRHSRLHWSRKPTNDQMRKASERKMNNGFNGVQSCGCFRQPWAPFEWYKTRVWPDHHSSVPVRIDGAAVCLYSTRMGLLCTREYSTLGRVVPSMTSTEWRNNWKYYTPREGGEKSITVNLPGGVASWGGII